MINNSYKAGVENTVYSNLVRTLTAHGKIQLVQDPENADAILQGTVTTATSVGTAGTAVGNLTPTGLGANLVTAAFGITTEYSATLGCTFTLTRRQQTQADHLRERLKMEADQKRLADTFEETKKVQGPLIKGPLTTEGPQSLDATKLAQMKVPKRSVIWSSTFSRSKPFPGANQLDVPGTTSSLINDSEFDRALSDLSRSMMDDVHESMLAMF